MFFAGEYWCLEQSGGWSLEFGVYFQVWIYETPPNGFEERQLFKREWVCAGLFQPLRHSKSWWNFHWKGAKEMGVSCQFMGSKRGSVEVLQGTLWTWNPKFCCTACLATQLSQRLLQVVRLNEIGYYVPRMYALILWCRSIHFHKRLCWHGFYIFLPGRCTSECVSKIEALGFLGAKNGSHGTGPSKAPCSGIGRTLGIWWI